MMKLDPKDFEALERLIYSCGDDIAVAIARSFGRLEDRVDIMESRIQARLGEVENIVRLL